MNITPHTPTIIYIGAYDGKKAIELANRHVCDIECFECNPSNIDLIRTIEDPRLKLWPYAVGSLTLPNIAINRCVTDSFYDSHRTPRRILKQLYNPAYVAIRFNGTYAAQSTTIDDWNYKVRCMEPVDLIVVDINGAEVDFIAGAALTLGRTTELHIAVYDEPMYARCMNEFQTMTALPGYTRVGRDGRMLQLKRRTV